MSILNNSAVKNREARKQFKRDQEQYNACWKEHNLCLKCLDNNDYDYEKCELYFENYRTCKKFWGKVISFRRSHDIKPWLPLPEDREKVKAEFFNSYKR